MLRKIFLNTLLALSLASAMPLSAVSNCPCQGCECTDCNCDNGEHCDHCDN